MPTTRQAAAAGAAKKVATATSATKEAKTASKPATKEAKTASKPATKEAKTETKPTAKEAKTASKPTPKASKPAKATSVPAPAVKPAAGKRARVEESEVPAPKAAKKANATAAKPAKAIAAPAAKFKKPTTAEAIAELNDDEIKLGAAENSDSEAEDNEDDAAILAGFSDVSDQGADSSDDDDDDDDLRKNAEISASGVVKLPSSRDDAVVRQRLDKANKKRKESGVRGTPIVLYFGRVPKTMPESALRAYLTQFGDVRRLRLSRNRISGASKHYAFVEFDDEEVGKIVQETMHNYLLEGRLLQVHVLPKERQHPSLWIGANRTFRKAPTDRLFRVKHDKPRTDEQKRQAEDKLLQRQDKRRKRIHEQGIDYDFTGYAK